MAAQVSAFAAAYQGRVGCLDAAELAKACAECEELLEPVQRATVFAEAQLAVDAEDSAAQGLLARCDEAWNVIAELAGFFEGEVAAIPAERAGELLADPDLANYANHLRTVRAAAGVQPPADAAAALSVLDPVGGAEQLARQLLARIQVRDSGRALGLGEALPVLYDPDRSHRRRVCDAISAALEPEVELRATVLCMLTRARSGRDQLAGISDRMQLEYLTNQLSPGEVNTLLNVAREHYDLVHRYYLAKATMLGHPLTEADRYAPVDPSVGEVSWPEAAEIVLGAFAEVHEDLVAAARDVLSRGLVDAVPRVGKRRGAATYSMPSGDACVLVNFTSRPRDVLTLAHELGHAVHARLSGGRGVFRQAVPTVLAETVGLFFETVAADRYSRLAGSPAARQALLSRWVEDQLVSVFRQVALHDFESELHAAVRSGDLPDAQALGELWMSGQRALYGPGVSLGDGFRHWWSYLDSFYFAPGSGYAYAYGQLAASALLARHRDDPTWLGARLAALLSAGSVRPPVELLRLAGVDVADSECWRGGLALLQHQIHEILGDAGGMASVGQVLHASAPRLC